MILTIETKQSSYPVIMERGVLKRAKEKIGREGHVFLISDDGVPEQWRSLLQQQYPDAHMHVFPQGEGFKNMRTLEDILEDMLDHGVSRKDTVIALGGGVCGDMAGFAAAVYMRGIHWVNIPTTTLAQIDSSIGGKTAVDVGVYKNCAGAFWQPDMVLVDPDVLSTLPLRHYNNGLAEAIKAGILKDPHLFELFETNDIPSHIDEIIARSLFVKKGIVERDETEQGERKLLNFGHTLGHAYEEYYGLDTYLHGECVAMGMMKMIRDDALKARLAKVLEKLDLPCACGADPEEILRLAASDKKADKGTITLVYADALGEAYTKETDLEELKGILGL
ncbi:MAG: 3-dehydroquinate synthase [Solobacterium sp.]|nr:3-dehydroquinate synthase [Solobacterium sp.]